MTDVHTHVCCGSARNEFEDCWLRIVSEKIINLMKPRIHYFYNFMRFCAHASRQIVLESKQML